jgi:hypothetical protein
MDILRIIPSQSSVASCLFEQHHSFRILGNKIFNDILIINLLQQTSLSSDIVVKSLSLSCVIVVRIYDFNNFNLEKLRSADATVTGMANKTLYAILAFGKQSRRLKNSELQPDPCFLLE